MPDRLGADEIVVDLSHVGDVEKVLNALPRAERERLHLSGRGLRELDRNDRLGLALLEIQYADDFKPDSPTAIRSVLGYVRKIFWDRDRWEPTIGRNRVLSHVGAGNHAADAAGGTSYIQGGGVLPTSYIQGGIAATSYIQGGGGGFPCPAEALADHRARPTAGRGVQVAVLDTPIYPNAALIGAYLADRSAQLAVTTRGHYYLAGHSTFVTGLIATRAPGAAIHTRSVLRPTNAGAKVWDVAVKMASLAGTEIDIVNLSMGCFTSDDRAPLTLMRAVDALTPDAIIVAAAGNYRGLLKKNGKAIPARPFWPAALDNVLAVGGLTAEGSDIASFSPNYPWVDVYAPAVNLKSTYLQGVVRFPARPSPTVENWPQTKESFDVAATWSGTSFAAGTVSGAIAALTIPGRRTAREALERIKAGADSDIRSARRTHG